MKDLNEVEQLAKDLMNQTYHIGNKSINIVEAGYKFKWDNAKRRFGRANYGKKFVGLSRPICQLNIDDDDSIKDTILHEIAHVLAYELYGHRGHGTTWKRCCVEIGAKPERCFNMSEVETPKPKYKAECSGCGKVYRRHRRPGGGAACGRCCNGTYNKDFILQWEEA